MGTLLAGGQPHYMPLTAENEFLPDLEAVPPQVVRQAKVLWLNYPNNPTAAVAGLDFFEKAVAFAREHDLVLCHDAPYTEVAFDGYRPVSLLQVPGAMDVGIEFHSWSKSYNMTGWRIGMVVGNAAAVHAMMQVKSNIDSGIPQAIQEMAMAALEGPQDCIAEHNAIYQRRRDRLIEVLNHVGFKAQPPKASLYVWTRVPSGYTSVSLATELLEKLSVVVTPGVGYGDAGEGYIRFSLTVSDDDLEEGLKRLSGWQPSR
jgi:LL-diaminopimelate aminotransferase